MAPLLGSRRPIRLELQHGIWLRSGSTAMVVSLPVNILPIRQQLLGNFNFGRLHGPHSIRRILAFGLYGPINRQPSASTYNTTLVALLLDSLTAQRTSVSA